MQRVRYFTILLSPSKSHKFNFWSNSIEHKGKIILETWFQLSQVGALQNIT